RISRELRGEPADRQLRRRTHQRRDDRLGRPVRHRTHPPGRRLHRRVPHRNTATGGRSRLRYRVLFHAGDPATALDAPDLNAIVYWIVAGVLLVGLALAGAWAWVLLRRHSRKAETDPHTTAGAATRHEVTTTASAQALLKRAGSLRPSLDKPAASDVGYRLGTCRGREVWASVEDSILLIGPPRSGKGLHVVIPAILDAPGAVIATST